MYTYEYIGGLRLARPSQGLPKRHKVKPKVSPRLRHNAYLLHTLGGTESYSSKFNH